MASSMLCKRAAVFCSALNWISAPKPVSHLISKYGLVLQAASYNPKPLRLNLREPYIPDRESEETPQWQKSARYDRKLFGRFGSASGVDPASLWPASHELDKTIAEESEWYPPLHVLQKNIAVREKEETERRLAREKIIAANMAKMPKMIADWRREKRETKTKLKEEKARRTKFLTEVRERLGYDLDPRSPKFLAMVAEMEKEEKKKRKLLKRSKQEALEPVVTPAAAS